MDKPPLVFVHGFLGSPRDWDEIVPHFSTYSCMCAEDFNLSGKAGIFIGYSMGGRVALEFALNHPENVKALILESTSAGIEDKEGREARIQSDEAWAKKLESESWDVFLKDWYSQPIFASLQNKKELLQKLMKARSMNDPRIMAKILRSYSVGLQESMWSRLPDLKIPTLFVAGEQDLKYVQFARRMKALVPSAECVVISDAGHVVHLEQPEAYARVVKQFLDGLRL